jgi:hypothetical protein
MAVKNLQTLALCVANQTGVRVTGTECNAIMQAMAKFQAPFLSLPWHPLPASTRLARTARRTVLSTRSSSMGFDRDSLSFSYPRSERKALNEPASQRRGLPECRTNLVRG